MPRSSTPHPEKISASIRSTSLAPLLSPILSTHSSTNAVIDLTRSPEPDSRSVGVASTPKRIRHDSSTSSESQGVTQYTVRAIIHTPPRSSTRSARDKVRANVLDILKDWSDDETASDNASSKVSVIQVRTRHKTRPIVYSSDATNLRSISREKSRPASRLFETLLPQNLIESSSKSTSPIPILFSDKSDEIISEPSSEDTGNVSSVRLYPDTSSPSIFIDLTTSSDDDDDADGQHDDVEKELELEAKRMDSERRKVSFVKPDYFHVDGVEWHSYNHEYIAFTFTSSQIYPNHFDPTLHYRFSLKFNGKRWIIKTFQVPNYEEILEVYIACNMYDEHVNPFLEFVLQVMRSNIDEQVELKNQKMRLYRLGRKIEINVSDEIMLSEFERSFLKRKRKAIAKRMRPPKRRKFIQ